MYPSPQLPRNHNSLFHELEGYFVARGRSLGHAVALVEIGTRQCLQKSTVRSSPSFSGSHKERSS